MKYYLTLANQRNSTYYNKHNGFHFGNSNGNQEKNLLHYRRNCLVHKIEFKVDEKKLMEAESKRVSLYQYIASIRKVKNLIMNSKQISDRELDDDRLALSKCILNVKPKLKLKTKRDLKRLQIKKKKKELKRKMKKHKSNFLLEPSFNHFNARHYIGNIVKAFDYLKDVIEEIASFEYLNKPILLKKFKSLLKNVLNINMNNLPYDKPIEINVLRHYNDDIFQSNSDNKTESFNQSISNSNDINHEDVTRQRRKLMKHLNHNELIFKQSKTSNEVLMEELYHFINQCDLITNTQKLIENKSNVIEQNDKRNNEEGLTYSNHKTPIDDKPKHKRLKKKTIIQHIYTTPSDEILNLIPLCAKKYTILSKYT